jgi:hypothetical protein
MLNALSLPAFGFLFNYSRKYYDSPAELEATEFIAFKKNAIVSRLALARFKMYHYLMYNNESS